MTKNALIEFFGWIGVFAILVAYAGNLLGLLHVDNITYLLLNALGSLGVLIDAVHQKNWQPVVLNAVWIGLAIFGFVRVMM